MHPVSEITIIPPLYCYRASNVDHFHQLSKRGKPQAKKAPGAKGVKPVLCPMIPLLACPGRKLVRSIR